MKLRILVASLTVFVISIGAPIQAQAGIPGTVSISTENGPKCLGLSGPAAASVAVTLTDCHGAPVWQKLADGRIGLGRASRPDFCLDVDSASLTPKNVNIWNCSGLAINQAWLWSGNGTIRRYNGCLSTNETDSGQLTIAACANQTWVQAVYKKIKAANTCRALNLVAKKDGLYRKPFTSITPLERELDGPPQKSTCAALLKKVQASGPATLADLPAYQSNLNKFFSNYCHRDQASGWRSDIQLRDTGPYIQQIVDGAWQGTEFGTHNAVVIWYSPEFYEFVQKRAAGDDTFPMPEGAMSVKEMYDPPSSDCEGEDPISLKPSEHGVAYFVRHGAISMDGWYWGYFGWQNYPEEVGDLSDQAAVDRYFAGLETNLAANQSWQSADGIPGTASVTFGVGTGWAPACIDCHASAKSYQTFADLKNITGGSAEDPINSYLSMNFPTAADPAVPKHTADAEKRSAPPLTKVITPYDAAFLKTFAPAGIFADGTAPIDASGLRMPSASFDTVWVKPNDGHKAAGVASQYVTSDQCVGCHDVGQTGLLYDMSTIDPVNKHFIDQAPYGTWRTSPMGLAGRDPIFFAQLASETQTFHNAPGTPAIVENVCLGCHGIQGQRQYTLDHAQTNSGDCGQFSRAMVDQIPLANGTAPAGSHPNYGALARDGISCTSCHHAIFKKNDIAKHFPSGKPDAQNKCVVARQQFLNPGVDHDTLAATFTGSYLVGDPGRIGAPMEKPQPKPMQNALGLTPHQDDTFSKSDICGSCHTVHLPILHKGKTVGTVFEQTTYPEWAFSEFRTGKTANYPKGGGTLPSGAPSAGKLQISCQRCHMESSNSVKTAGFPNGLVFPDLAPENRYISKIATIQEKTNFPASDNTLPAKEIDLQRREGFARHTLVGLNVFFMSMAKQFPDVLGIPKDAKGYMGLDPTKETTNLPFIDRTLRRMQGSAKTKTATIALESAEITDSVLNAKVKIVSGVAHKFPSGVGFRRAFVEFKVLDALNNTLWGSGVTNGAGVIMDNGANPAFGSPIDGELWWDQDCNPVEDRLAFQPHFQRISKQNQAQIYQELVMAPPPNADITPEAPGHAPVKTANQPVTMCGTQLGSDDNQSIQYPGWSLTTSFLSICAQAKDNRLLPQGYLPLADRVAISKMFTGASDPKAGVNAGSMAEKLAKEGGSWGVGSDPDYTSVDNKPYGGGDTFTYAIPLSDIAGAPAKVSASIYYQATPPFYLQDRFCTAKGDDRDRLYYLAGKLNLDKIADGWKLPIASAVLAVPAPR